MAGGETYPHSNGSLLFLNDKRGSPLIKGFSNTTVVSACTPNERMAPGNGNVQSYLNSATVRCVAGESTGPRGIWVCRYFAKAAAKIPRHVAACADRDLFSSGNGRQRLNARRLFARSTRHCGAITAARLGPRLTRYTALLSRSGRARSLFPAPRSWEMHPVGHSDASKSVYVALA